MVYGQNPESPKDENIAYCQEGNCFSCSKWMSILEWQSLQGQLCDLIIRASCLLSPVGQEGAGEDGRSSENGAENETRPASWGQLCLTFEKVRGRINRLLLNIFNTFTPVSLSLQKHTERQKSVSLAGRTCWVRKRLRSEKQYLSKSGI